MSEKYKPKEYMCGYCGNTFINRWKKATCGKGCETALRSQKSKDRQVKNFKTCEICGKLFPSPQSNKVFSCSKRCSKILHSKRLKGKPMSEEARQKAIDRGLTEQFITARANNPKTAPAETNIHAKSWVLEAPDGDIYNITNLNNFFRDYPALIPNNTYKQASRGIMQIKRSLQGKIPKNKACKSWKGWHLIAWSDDFANRQDI